MNWNKLEQIFQKEPAFRKKQALKFVYQDLKNDWNEATVFSKDFRDFLNKTLSLEIKAKIFWAKNKKSAKALLVLEDGLEIETVLMKTEKRNTICVSSQVGCPLGCLFCATGKMGFFRNLEVWEIIDQVLLFSRMLKNDFNEKVTNVVFMGMGEPFLNYDKVMQAANFLNSKQGFGIASRKISISTAGVVPGIEKFTTENKQFNLAVSLHLAENEKRNKIMKINKEYPLEILLNSLNNYVQKTKRKVMLEYSLFAEVNDGEDDAKKLVELIKKNRNYFMVNLIEYNDIGNESFLKKASPEKMKNFKKVLENNKIEFSERFRFAREIKGACGQLAGKN